MLVENRRVASHDEPDGFARRDKAALRERAGHGQALAAQLACRENLIARPCLGHEAQAGVNHAAKMQDYPGQKPTRKRKRHGEYKPCGARARGRLRECVPQAAFGPRDRAPHGDDGMGKPARVAEGKVGREPGGDGKNRHHRASPPEAGRTSRRQRPSQVAAHAPPVSVCTSKYPIFGTASSESSAFTVPA